MAANLDLFEGPDFDFKLTEGLATSNFEFVTPLKKDERLTQSPTEGEAELQLPLKVELALEPDQAGGNSLYQINSTHFRSAPQATGSASPAIAELLEDSGSGSKVPQFEPLVSDVSRSNARSSDIINNVPKSGDIKIDSLLYPYKWRDSTITYSFFDGGSYYGKEKNVKEITGKMKSYLRDILENVLEPLINVDFVEVSDKGNNYGQIRYMFSDNPSSAYTKSMSNGSPLAGDVHFNPDKTKYFEQGPGAYRYETLIHETLHALGLKHPGNYNSAGKATGPFLPNHLDNSANSILSYNRLSDKSPFTGAITPMTHDIKALQYLYGAKEHEAGNTTYKFDSVYGYTVGGDFFGGKTQGIKQTIWDSAGKDTFDFSGLASNKSGYHFDLREGGWITTQKAYESTSYKARGNGKTYKTTALGTKTAFGATIENMVTSTSNDTIIANKAPNIFSGYDANTKTGDDTIVNSNGRDQLLLSGYQSSDVSQTTRGDNLILGLGGNGSITLKDYYVANQNDRIQILFDGTTPPPPSPPGQTSLVWEDLGLKDEAAVVSGSKFDLDSGLRATIDWNTQINGGNFVHAGGKDFVSYERGMRGAHEGYLELGFNNDTNDPNDVLGLSIRFNQAIVGLDFDILDVDQHSSFDDGVEIYIDGVNLRDIPDAFTLGGSSVKLDNERNFKGFEGRRNAGNPSKSGNIHVSLGSRAASEVEIFYSSTDDAISNPGKQSIGISDLHWLPG